MIVEQKATLHNKHHLVLTDKEGKVKQEGWAYNIILNQGFTQLIEKHFGDAIGISLYTRRLFGNDTTRGCFGVTFLGEDDGTISPIAAANTAMGTYLDRKENTYYDHEYDMDTLTASHTRSATWLEAELQNTDIKEVGLGVDHQTTGLCTRALIEDAEGNPITISKGTTDILAVYSTVYIELSHAYGENFKFVESASSNFLLNHVAFSAQPSSTLYCPAVGRSKDVVLATDYMVKTSVFGPFLQSSDAAITYSGANKRIEFDYRVPIGSGNHADGLWEVGLAMRTIGQEIGIGGTYPVFRSLMPLTGVWEGTEINANLGDGDGAQTEFGPPTFIPIKAGSYTVKVNDVTKTEGTDYTINTATGIVTFTAGNIPGVGEPVTMEYTFEGIPKDSNHLLKIKFFIQFADGNA